MFKKLNLTLETTLIMFLVCFVSCGISSTLTSDRLEYAFGTVIWLSIIVAPCITAFIFLRFKNNILSYKSLLFSYVITITLGVVIAVVWRNFFYTSNTIEYDVFNFLANVLLFMLVAFLPEAIIAGIILLIGLIANKVKSNF